MHNALVLGPAYWRQVRHSMPQGMPEMWTSIYGELFGVLDRFKLIAVAHPFQFTVYPVLIVLLAAVLVYFLNRKQPDHAFWCVIGIILIDFLFSSGHDTGNHVYRIVAISEQLRHGNVSLLLTNPTTGEAFPVFVYYSFLPYVLPTALNLMGISALLAFKIAAGLQLIVLGFGLQVFIKKTSSPPNSNPHPDPAFLAAILFVSANYVSALWTTRAALGELWVYSFVPWVVIAILSPRAKRSLTALLFVQICAHPIVFLQSFVCELIVAFGVSKISPISLGRRCIAPLTIALVLASPFWLPQLIWLRFVLGDTALPVLFSNTFLSFRELVDPRLMQNIGLWIPCALALMIIASRAYLPARVWVLASAFVALLALQTVYLRGIATHVPFLEQSQFVWRFMLPAAFIAFGTLVIGWRVLDRPAGWALVPLALLSVFSMLLVHVSVPGRIALLSTTAKDINVDVDTEYLSSNNIWGVRLFVPNYSQVPQKCDLAPGEIQATSFSELRTGAKADHPFLTVQNGPIGFVEYKSNGVVLRPSACDDTLVLGPLKPNSRVWVAEDILNNLLHLRVIGFAASLLAILLLIPTLLKSARLSLDRSVCEHDADHKQYSRD
jgi:hypothetical protein